MSNDPVVALGARVAAARRATGMSQSQAAARIGIHRSALSDVETGVRALSALELGAMAALYGRSADELLATPRPPMLRDVIQRLAAATADLATLEKEKQ